MMMKLPTEISPAEAGGWLAALGVLSIWLVRALSYSRRFGKFEGRLDERLKALEQGQAAISTKVDKGYYFIGRKSLQEEKRWVEINSPAHNVESSVRYELDERDPSLVAEYPPRLFNNYLDYRYSYPFYYGRWGKMAWLLMFDEAGPVRFSHSPTSGARVGPGTEPAWDFHYLFYNYKVGEKYGFKARLVYKPFVSRADIIAEYEKWSGEKVEMP